MFASLNTTASSTTRTAWIFGLNILSFFVFVVVAAVPRPRTSWAKWEARKTFFLQNLTCSDLSAWAGQLVMIVKLSLQPAGESNLNNKKYMQRKAFWHKTSSGERDFLNRSILPTSLPGVLELHTIIFMMQDWPSSGDNTKMSSTVGHFFNLAPHYCLSSIPSGNITANRIDIAPDPTWI